MKIPVRVEFFAGGLRPLISICVKSQEPKIFGLVNAIIDTGSPTTILGWGDVQKIRLSQVQMKRLEGAEKEINIGGAQIKTRVLPEAELIFGGRNLKISSIQVPIKLVKGTPPPTILGVDFLLQGKFSFFFNPDKRESYLEVEDN